MSNILFITNNPLGNEIKLLKETFEKHIIIRHPEMKARIQEIKKVIEKPLYIGRGMKSKDSVLYLGEFPNTNTPYLIVAVRKVKKLDRIILTAFGTRNLGLNKINKVLWQQKKENLIIPTLQSPKN